MDYVLQKVLKKLGDSYTELSKTNLTKIKSLMPVPREHSIKWAYIHWGGRISGIVLTDKGLFVKGSEKMVQDYNTKQKDKKNRINSIYHYIRWDFFEVGDFETISENGLESVKFDGKTILQHSAGNKFFKLYESEYNNQIKESSVVASNIFANVESVVPDNFAFVNTKTGHGEMAEEALNLLDKISGLDAEVIGRTNKKDGADRLVKGIEIQTKYYPSGRGCVNACFDKNTGIFRYYSSSGEPMLIEVPRDVYAESINVFRKKILEGKVPGVTNPDEATKFIKKGKLSYKQALNLCKPGTIESLTYDVATGAINCTFALGITFLTTFVISYSASGEKSEAMKDAAIAGVQVFGLAFISHIFTQQVARTSLTKQLIPLSSYIVKSLGYKTTQSIVNSLRGLMGKSSISGAAAANHLGKILRGNVVTSVITFAVFSVPDTYSMFKRRLSTAQYTKNMLSLIGTMSFAGGGTLGAALITAKFGAATGTTITPGIGTAIGFTGGIVGGFLGGVIIKTVGDRIREDDTVILARLFNEIVVNLIYEYMLSKEEINELVEKFDKIKHKEFSKLFRLVVSSEKQESEIEAFLRKYFEEIIRGRATIAEPSTKDLIDLVESLGTESEE